MKEKKQVWYLMHLFSDNSFLKNGSTKREMEITCEVSEHNNDFRKFVNSLVKEGVFHIINYTDNKSPLISSNQIKIIKKLRKIEIYRDKVYPVGKFDTETF